MLKLHCRLVLAGDDLGHLTMAPQTINGEVLNMPSSIPPNALENSSSRRRGDQTFPHDDTTSAITDSEGAHFPTVLSRDSSQHLVGHAGIMANGNLKKDSRSSITHYFSTVNNLKVYENQLLQKKLV